MCKEVLGGIDGIRLQREVGESSWFGFSLLLEGRLAGRRRELVEALRANGIECRPIAAGNFLRNPVIRFIDHTVSGSVDVADDIDNNGLFIGNHHYDLAEQLEYCRRVLDHFVVGLDF